MKKLAFLLLAGLTVGLGACGNNGTADNQAAGSETGTEYGTGNTANTDNAATATGEQGDSADEVQLVQDASGVAQQMQQDSSLAGLLQKAQGVFIVPTYGKGAFIVGGRGGEGVLLANNSGQWSDPVFYNIGAISVGPQIGGAGGPIAMLLMSQKAVDSFKGENNFSLDANAGFDIADYSAEAQGDFGKADVILWSNVKGAFVGASLGGTDINFDGDANQAYYNQPQVNDAGSILTGNLTAPSSAQSLQQALPTPTASGSAKTS